MIRVMDLFSGIGGFSLGLKKAGGFTTVCYCEIDQACQQVLYGLMLDGALDTAPICTDVKRLDGAPWAGRVELICGGFPCQDISAAGLRAGIDGERSGLWREIARLVRQVRPRYVLVENVAALLGRGIDVVLGDLAALGFDAEWGVLGADDFGATQHRERVWILAYAHDAGLQGPVWIGEPPPPRPAWEAAHSEPLRSGVGHWPPGPLAVAHIPRMADGPTDRMDRLRGLGNAVVPDCAEFIGRRLIESVSTPSTPPSEVPNV